MIVSRGVGFSLDAENAISDDKLSEAICVSTYSAQNLDPIKLSCGPSYSNPLLVCLVDLLWIWFHCDLVKIALNVNICFIAARMIFKYRDLIISFHTLWSEDKEYISRLKGPAWPSMSTCSASFLSPVPLTLLEHLPYYMLHQLFELPSSTSQLIIVNSFYMYVISKFFLH